MSCVCIQGRNNRMPERSLVTVASKNRVPTRRFPHRLVKGLISVHVFFQKHVRTVWTRQPGLSRCRPYARTLPLHCILGLCEGKHSLSHSCSTLQLERSPSSADRSNCPPTRAVGAPTGQRESQHPREIEASSGR
eukprot:366406-Chlamydomonas_euryale.AAC.24